MPAGSRSSPLLASAKGSRKKGQDRLVMLRSDATATLPLDLFCVQKLILKSLGLGRHQTCSLLALLEQVSPGRPAFPAWEKAWASCPRSALGSRSRVGGARAGRRRPTQLMQPAGTRALRRGHTSRPIGARGCHLGLAPPLPPGTVTTAVTCRT